jgi:hypothetical protein
MFTFVLYSFWPSDTVVIIASLVDVFVFEINQIVAENGTSVVVVHYYRLKYIQMRSSLAPLPYVVVVVEARCSGATRSLIHQRYLSQMEARIHLWAASCALIVRDCCYCYCYCYRVVRSMYNVRNQLQYKTDPSGRILSTNMFI